MSIEKPTLLLYSRSSCPFCRKVNNYLKSIDKSIPTKDIGKDPAAAKELVKIGGKQQVPCLVINGKPLYESSDIIAWLKENPNKY
ncbi:MAG: glutathione S-transferase N-terminal domain-containing protein [Chlamydiia bacterium]|nr:glutathione S-transferase N-terminal domain-containing protein [Chlamydiia bacterium]